MTGREPLRLLLDEMLSAAIAANLRVAGFDVTAVVEDAMLVGSPDDEVLARAAEQGRALATADIADFTVIARNWRATGRRHHGIVYVAGRTFPQDRAFTGRMTDALGALGAAGAPAPDAEVFLARAAG